MTTFDTALKPETPDSVVWRLDPVRERTATDFEFDVAIVGLGYVGLPTALAFHNSGSRVLALDVSPQRLAVIRSQEADLLETDHVRLRGALEDPRFHLTTDPSLLSSAAAVIVCVPTPVDEHLIPDLRILRSACEMVVDRAVPGQLAMLTSTSYVGCTTDLLVKPLIARGFEMGVDMFVAFSAERINPGVDDVAHDDVPRVVGGATPVCEQAAVDLISKYAASVYRVASLATAEMTKLLENTFRAVNIALANEFADICRALEIPVTDVISAASTKPYGFMPFLPGPGVGGHCIPCDPHYLLWQLRKEHVQAPMITQAMTEIAARPTRVVDRVRELLANSGIGLGGARVLVVGVSYKPDVADLRESPALEILAGLYDSGAHVGFVDPHYSSLALPNGQVLNAMDDPAVFDADLVLLHTRHTGGDLAWVSSDQLVLDATYRNAELPQSVLL
ncbi:MAG: UDP-glucose 6-dehydrogenase [Glaciihabitans sp.]|nr:UDP-glucose 6-dehydrogenase [Glaciihabitans sp.]